MTNRLAQETSPYLRQHADNPVDWYAWSEDALELARVTGRPILLSVGYSACHWCHVMAHECFEDAETAARMNRDFVNIKVDREERPDIDRIYQTAHQLITRRAGGWPLTMFLTPQGKPFFGGTYFPKHARYQMPGFDQILERVAQLWSEQREQIVELGDALVRQLHSTLPSHGVGAADSSDAIDASAASEDARTSAMLEATARQAPTELRNASMQSFDTTYGGFGAAPKFPQPSNLDALLQHSVREHDVSARDAVLLTLRRMAEGGLYDHLGGGFYRYSTDEKWMIPHFEKMLYDNGPLLRLYAQAWQVTGEPLFRQVCQETAQWLIREMQSAEGGYFSSLDADSEGEEGRYYVWHRDEVAGRLSPDAMEVFAARYGLDDQPNFEGKAWHLHQTRPVAAVATAAGRSPDQSEALIAQARAQLLSLRDTRTRPGTDSKILTSWNALAIDGMAYAARVLGEPGWVASAGQAADFLRQALWRDGRLLATYKDGRSHLNAYLDDYAFMLGAMLELIQGRPLRAADLRFACGLADVLLDQFEDPIVGGFFFTSHDHEALVLRPKSGDDGATSSGNGMAALYLQRLGHLVGEPRYLDAARRTLTLFAGDVKRAPQAFASLIAAMDEYAAPPPVVVLSGPPAVLDAWSRELFGRYQPGLMVLQLSADTAGLPDVLTRPATPVPQAWVCMGPQCLLPMADLASVLAALDGVQRGLAA